MKLAVPKETSPGERRVAFVPESVKKAVKAGIEVTVQAGCGVESGFLDADYQSAGAKVEADTKKLFAEADLVLKVQPPCENTAAGGHEAALLKPGAIFIAAIKPSVNLPIVRKLQEAKVTALALDCVPRITRAQSMDILSSQATIAGYKAVLIAANELGKMFPMMMTAAGTLMPVRAFIIGAGVAGLQAIAQARRMGANVEATDTRSVVKEQIESLGAKFIGVESAEDAQDARGYAKELSADFYRKQAELIRQRCALSDVVITTALIGGVKAPKLITEDMVQGMKPGSVIVDVAAEGGGNCTITEPGKTVVKHGVKICGPANLPSLMPDHASLMYSRNLSALLHWFYKDGSFRLDFEDEILKGCAITHEGKVLHGPTRDALEKEKGGGA